MNQAQAQRVVFGVVLVCAALIAWDNIKRTGKATPSGRSLVSLVVLAAALSLGATVAPAIAGPFALLVGLAVAVSRGGGGGGGFFSSAPRSGGGARTTDYGSGRRGGA